MTATSSTLSRRVASEFAIGLMVCAGGYYFLVNPARNQAASIRAQIDQVQKQAAETHGMASLTDDQTRELTRLTSERAHEIAARSAPARNEAGMFSAVMDLANRHRVRIDQLQPNGAVAALAPVAVPMPDPTMPPVPPPPKDAHTGYTLSLVADYSDLTGFVNSLQSRLGYTVVRSLRAVPSGDHTPNLVHAVIETEHFAFDLAGVDTQPVKPVANAPESE